MKEKKEEKDDKDDKDEKAEHVQFEEIPQILPPEPPAQVNLFHEFILLLFIKKTCNESQFIKIIKHIV